jgi:hypothetical protein
MISSRSFDAVVAMFSFKGMRHIALANPDNLLSSKLIFSLILPNETGRHLSYRQLAKRDLSCGMHDNGFDVILRFRQLGKVVWPSHGFGTYSLCIAVSHK